MSRETRAALAEYFAQSDGITIGIPAELAQAIAGELRELDEFPAVEFTPIREQDNLIDGDDWQYSFQSHQNSDVAFCFIRGDKSEGLVHIDGALDAESLERLAAYLRRA